MMRAVLGWIAVGVPWILTLWLWYRLRREQRLVSRWSEAAIDAALHAKYHERLNLTTMRSSFDMATALLLAHDRGVMETIEDDLRMLVEELGNQVAKAEEHVV